MTPGGSAARSEQIVDFISGYVEQNGFAPTVREICDGVGLRSLGYVHTLIKKLVDEGRLTQGPGGSSRTLRVTR